MTRHGVNPRDADPLYVPEPEPRRSGCLVSLLALVVALVKRR